MMRTLAQTGNGWMTFKDPSNARCNQTAEPGNVVHLSNLCTEIIEVSSDAETAVCNLGSVNLARHLTTAGDGTVAVDWPKLRRHRAHRRAVPGPGNRHRLLPERAGGRVQPALAPGRARRDGPPGRAVRAAAAVRLRRRPQAVGPGWPRRSTSPRWRRRPTWPSASARIRRSARRARPRASCSTTCGASRGTQASRWTALRTRIAGTGLRNSLLIAIAPTATIASIAGCYECIEPQVSNLFKRETLSGEFMQVNAALVTELKAHGLWTTEVRDAIKRADGSVQQAHAAACRCPRSCSARPGNCRSARSSTSRRRALRSSTRASR